MLITSGSERVTSTISNKNMFYEIIYSLIVIFKILPKLYFILFFPQQKEEIQMTLDDAIRLIQVCY